jgi:protein involved in polysaccharide export with SLBB domain
MRALAALVLAAGLLAGCAGALDRPACVAAATATADPATGYRLGPQDQVKLTIYRQEELSGQFALDGNGELALPLIGDIMAAGLTSRQLEDEIERRLAEGGYLVAPQVGVQLLTYRPFYILGEVAKPGSYEYRDGMTVINAVALAGGYSYRADTDDVIIERGDCAMPTMADTTVLPGDIIKVSERFF